MNLSKCYVRSSSVGHGYWNHRQISYHVYIEGKNVRKFSNEVLAYKYLIKRIRKELTCMTK